MSSDHLFHLKTTIQQDIEVQKYDGMVIALARGGKILFHEAFGFSERASGRRMKKDDVFCVFSISKAFVNLAVLQKIDMGDLALTTPVASIIPEFGARGKHRITIHHLLTHTSGISLSFPQIAFQDIGNLDAYVRGACQQPLESTPGSSVRYSALTAHAILADVVRRVDRKKRSYRQILEDEFFLPLGMQDTSLGLRKDLSPHRVPVVVRDTTAGLYDPIAMEFLFNSLDETSEIPGGGIFSTAWDLLQFAEMLRLKGSFHGSRFVSSALMEQATRNHTGEMTNHLFDYAREMYGWPDFPAYLGLGFFLRGSGIFPTYFGTTASESAFGAIGSGSTLLFVDPKRDMTLVCLSSGLLDEAHSLLRFQRLSDLAIAAVDEVAECSRSML